MNELTLEQRFADLHEDFLLIKEESESRGRQATAFEEAMGIHQARAGKLEAELAAARSKIKRLEKHKRNYKALRAVLDEVGVMQADFEWAQRIRDVLKGSDQ